MTQFNEQYMRLLRLIKKHGVATRPRGMLCFELLFQRFVIEDGWRDSVITIPGFETNVEYAAEELQWYLSGSNGIAFSPLIERTWEKFSDDGVFANSGYGARLFCNKEELRKVPPEFAFMDQWRWVQEELKRDPDSRRAVINVNSVSDKMRETKDFPCTISFQAILRGGRLHWITTMRSQDIYLGTRNDVFCFTRLQEKMAHELGAESGTYVHDCHSLHLYERQFKKLDQINDIKED